MGYFVTGATGFVGGHLVEQLLASRTGPIHCLVREASVDALEARIRGWGTNKSKVKPVVGNLTAPRLGVTVEALDGLAGDVDHVFHLAAIYDMTASADAQHEANVEGTRHVLEAVEHLSPRCFHHVSSIAAAGRYRGTFSEDMFDEATGLDHPYFATKHASEALVREHCPAPWRVYRPSIVVGHSETGAIDKVDGPYYFFALIKRLRDMLPPWLPLVGIDGPPINLVPVDFVAAALDHIAHLDDTHWDGQAFHLVDPDPYRLGQIVDILTRAAHAPRPVVNLDAGLVRHVPAPARAALAGLPPVRSASKAALARLGIPEQVLAFVDWPTTYASERARSALAGSGIEVPRLDAYAERLWKHWERHLDDDRSRTRLSLHRDLPTAIRGRVVLVTGASRGIGREVALRAAAAGAHVLLVSRTREKLEKVAAEIAESGGAASVHPADMSEPDDVERVAAEVLEEHGGVDVLVNNAGRSIRRSVRLSLDRFHDYERTMGLNYFGPVRLVLALLPSMLERKYGHIINISSIGVQTNVPRFSAYVASKSALDGFSRCIASEVIDDGVRVTTVFMPLVRTEMIAPTKLYDYFPAITPEKAAAMVCDAMVDRPKKVATALGNFGEVAYAAAPKLVDRVLHAGYRIFPDSAAARGADEEERASGEGLAFAHLLRGVHW